MKIEKPARSGWARVLPAPLLSLGLWLLWLMLNQSLAPGAMLLGAAVALAVPWLVAPLRPARPAARTLKLRAALQLLGRVLSDVVQTSFVVARGVLRRTPPRAAMVVVPLALRVPSGLALFAVIMCLTPDTLWAELSADGRELKIHVFDLTTDEATYVAQVKARYEKLLLELFQS